MTILQHLFTYVMKLFLYEAYKPQHLLRFSSLFGEREVTFDLHF